MSEDDIENLDSSNETEKDTDIEGEELEIEETKTEDTEDVSKLKEQLAKKNEQNIKLFERAKKAEGFVKDENGKWVKKETPPKPEPKEEPQGFTLQDIRALGSVHDDDVDFVVSWAKANKMSIPQAVKDKDVKVVLANREEERKTAEATHTGPSRKQTTKPDDATLLSDADKGKFPDDPAELARARLNSKLPK